MIAAIARSDAPRHFKVRLALNVPDAALTAVYPFVSAEDGLRARQRATAWAEREFGHAGQWQVESTEEVSR